MNYKLFKNMEKKSSINKSKTKYKKKKIFLVWSTLELDDESGWKRQGFGLRVRRAWTIGATLVCQRMDQTTTTWWDVVEGFWYLPWRFQQWIWWEKMEDGLIEVMKGKEQMKKDKWRRENGRTSYSLNKLSCFFKKRN